MGSQFLMSSPRLGGREVCRAPQSHWRSMVPLLAGENIEMTRQFNEIASNPRWRILSSAQPLSAATTFLSSDELAAPAGAATGLLSLSSLSPCNVLPPPGEQQDLSTKANPSSSNPAVFFFWRP